jgi:hypothetical protein
MTSKPSPPERIDAMVCPKCSLIGGVVDVRAWGRKIARSVRDADCPACEDHPKLVRVRYQLARRRAK